MNQIGIFSLLLALVFNNYVKSNRTTVLIENQTEKFDAHDSIKTKEEIQYLIRQVLNWADWNKSIDILPAVADSGDSIYIGFDLDRHRQNLDVLRKTNLFAIEFIENYNQIILTLDKGLKNGDYVWFHGEFPPFMFSNGAVPWCMCQDSPYDNPSPWDFLEIEIISLDSIKGELNWKWGKLELNPNPGWKEFAYRFRVVKENNKWKISYLQGFDYAESIRY